MCRFYSNVTIINVVNVTAVFIDRMEINGYNNLQTVNTFFSLIDNFPPQNVFDCISAFIVCGDHSKLTLMQHTEKKYTCGKHKAYHMALLQKAVLPSDPKEDKRPQHIQCFFLPSFWMDI